VYREAATDSAFEALMKDLREHVKHEENEQLPKLEKVLGSGDSASLAASFERTKYFVPTRCVFVSVCFFNSFIWFFIRFFKLFWLLFAFRFSHFDFCIYIFAVRFSNFATFFFPFLPFISVILFIYDYFS
jgi:hypothetical protein